MQGFTNVERFTGGIDEWRASGNVTEVEDDTEVATILNILEGSLAVDVRITQDYAAGHIPGALSVPAADLVADPAGSLSGVATDAAIVIYGAGGSATATEYGAAMALDAAGYTNVRYYKGGIANWIAGGRATE